MLPGPAGREGTGREGTVNTVNTVQVSGMPRGGGGNTEDRLKLLCFLSVDGAFFSSRKKNKNNNPLVKAELKF